nr:putative reverse transcriptase domain-containing protein [Tanacetum cinerariifolium]
MRTVILDNSILIETLLKTDALNPPPPASDFEPEDVIEVEDTVEPEDETVPASVYEVKAKDRYYGKLIFNLGNGVQFRVEEGTTAMENLVKKLGNAKERAECKKLKKEPIMPPKSVPLTQVVVRRMIKESVMPISLLSGQDKRIWFEKTESIFGISECAEGKKVKFDAVTLQGPALTWWNSKVATMGLETVNQLPWTEMK